MSDTAKLLKPVEAITSAFSYFFYRKASHYFYNHSIRNVLTSVKEIDISETYTPVELINNRVFRGLMHSLFTEYDYYPSVADIAVAINISLSHFNQNRVSDQSQLIIDLSYHLLTEIREAIIRNKILYKSFNDYGKDTDKLTIDSNRTYIESLFADKKALFTHYFLTFQDNKYYQRVQIWHQGNNNTWVDWSEENSITINMNIFKIREGFFLQGFDYCDVTRKRSLSVASNKDGYEYFNKRIDGDTVVWRN